VKIITINLPEKYLSAIQTLCAFGIYPSRSEAVRTALRDFLMEEIKFDKSFDIHELEILRRGAQN